MKRFTLAVTMSTLISTALTSTVAFASAPPLAPDGAEILDVIVAGKGCPDSTVDMEVQPDLNKLSLLFSDYKSISMESRKRAVGNSCTVGIPVYVPEGYAVAIKKLTIRGDIYVPHEGKVRITADTLPPGQSNGITIEKEWSYEEKDSVVSGAYTLKGVIGDDYLAWSGCDRESATLYINSQLKAFKGVDENSEISIVESTKEAAAIDAELIWKSCSSTEGEVGAEAEECKIIGATEQCELFESTEPETGTEMDEEITETGTEMDEESTETGTDFDEETTETGTEMDDITTGTGTEMDDITTETGTEMDDITTETGTEMDDVATETGTEMDDVTTETGTEMDDVITETGTEMDDVTTETGTGFDGEITETGTDFDEEMTEAGTDFDEETTETGAGFYGESNNDWN